MKDAQFFNTQRLRRCTSCQLEPRMKSSSVAGLSLLSTSPSAPRFAQRSGFVNSVLPEDRPGTEGLCCEPWKLPCLVWGAKRTKQFVPRRPGGAGGTMEELATTFSFCSPIAFGTRWTACSSVMSVMCTCSCFQSCQS